MKNSVVQETPRILEEIIIPPFDWYRVAGATVSGAVMMGGAGALVKKYGHTLGNTMGGMAGGVASGVIGQIGEAVRGKGICWVPHRF